MIQIEKSLGYVNNERLAKGMAASGEAAQKASVALRELGYALAEVYYQFVLEMYALPFARKH